ncbi:hypothetical protein BDF22DRAFT_14398 [Syncephalis plumigaleata]|nr:hypothetical protein BDF22DRAFT_14398 [Syncephalis plumigaleata]
MLRKLTGGSGKKSVKSYADREMSPTITSPTFAPNRGSADYNSKHPNSRQHEQQPHMIYTIPMQQTQSSNGPLGGGGGGQYPAPIIGGAPMVKSQTAPSPLMVKSNGQQRQYWPASNAPTSPPNRPPPKMIDTNIASHRSNAVDRLQPGNVDRHGVNQSAKHSTPSHIITPNFQYPRRSPSAVTPLNTPYNNSNSNSNNNSFDQDNLHHPRTNRPARSAPGTPVEHRRPSPHMTRVDHSHSSKASLSSLADLEESINNIIDSHRNEPVPSIPAHIVAKLEAMENGDSPRSPGPVSPQRNKSSTTLNSYASHTNAMPSTMDGENTTRRRQITPSFIAPPPPSKLPPVHLRTSMSGNRASLAPLHGNTSPKNSTHARNSHIATGLNGQAQASTSLTSSSRIIPELTINNASNANNTNNMQHGASVPSYLSPSGPVHSNAKRRTLTAQEMERFPSFGDDIADNPLVTQQQIARMIADTQSYRVLSSEEYGKLSDEYSMLQARLGILRDAHAKEVRILDCALSLLQLHRGKKNKRAERKAMDELQFAHEKVNKVLLDLWRLNSRMAEVRAEMNNHQAAILRVGIARLESTNRRLRMERERKRRTVVSSVLFSEMDMSLIEKMNERNSNSNSSSNDNAVQSQALVEAEARITELEEVLMEINEDLERAREESESAKRACETEASTAASARHQLQEVGRLLALISPSTALEDKKYDLLDTTARLNGGSGDGDNNAMDRASGISTHSNIILSQLERMHDEVDSYRHRIRELEEELMKQAVLPSEHDTLETGHLVEEDEEREGSGAAQGKSYDTAVTDAIAEIRKASEDELESLRHQLEERTIEVSDLREQLEEACCDVRDLELCQESIVTPLQDMFSVLPPAPKSIADDDASCPFTFPGFLARVEALRYKYSLIAKGNQQYSIDVRSPASPLSIRSPASPRLSYISGAASSAHDSIYNDSEADAPISTVASASLSRIQIVKSPLISPYQGQTNHSPVFDNDNHPYKMPMNNNSSSNESGISSSQHQLLLNPNGKHAATNRRHLEDSPILPSRRSSIASSSSLAHETDEHHDNYRHDSDHSEDGLRLYTPSSHSTSISAQHSPRFDPAHISNSANIGVAIAPTSSTSMHRKRQFNISDHQLQPIAQAVQAWTMNNRPESETMFNHSSGLDRLINQLDSITLVEDKNTH